VLPLELETVDCEASADTKPEDTTIIGISRVKVGELPILTVE
jgi:hypothetical protein